MTATRSSRSTYSGQYDYFDTDRPKKQNKFKDLDDIWIGRSRYATMANHQLDSVANAVLGWDTQFDTTIKGDGQPCLRESFLPLESPSCVG